MDQVFLLHYDEIALKGRNRTFFENKLISNIRQIAKKNKIETELARLWGRIMLKSSSPSEISKILAKTPGLAWFAPAYSLSPALDNYKKAINQLSKKDNFSTFAIRAKVADKSLPFKSKEIEEILGDWVRKNFNKKVNLDNPDLTFFVEIISKKQAFVYAHKMPSLGGLPVGSNGQALSLLSGGIDSPVAAYLMLSRGLGVDFVHFHSYPQTNQASLEKTKKLTRILAQYQPQTKLYLIPFLEIQKQMFKNCNHRYLVILYRRTMLKISEQVAKKEGYQALITGDALGQVASQTVENLSLQNQATTLSILRPLVGFSKKEIINLAQKIKTYSTSIEPHQDCCSLFVPKSPATKAKLEQIEKEEEKLDLDKLIKEALTKMEEEK